MTHSHSRSNSARVRALVVGATLVAFGTPLLAPAAQAATPEDDPSVAVGDAELGTGRDPYPGDPDSEAAHVAAEDDRLVEVRTVDSLSARGNEALRSPYRLGTGSAYTLVLTARREPYTVEDLLNLAPQTFVRQPDGAYLLSEHLVVQAGATLNLASSGGLRLLLASDGDGFVSLVNYGGRLNISGTEGAPVDISSFNRNTERPDRTTEDGRAYVRSFGGQVHLKHTELSDLGFWSGRTGGLSLTGTDRPDGGALDDLGDTLKVREDGAAVAAGGSEKDSDTDLEGAGPSDLSDVLPAGPLPVPMVDVESPKYSFVSASLADVKVSGNAFGLFVSGANGLDIRNSAFSSSLVDGIVLHRYVVNAVIEGTSAAKNGGDGMVLARATTGIVLSEVRADGNSRNGITMSGLPLAEGPSATGISVGSYGNNSVANSHMADNGRYGVEVIGGINVGVLANDVRDNDMGVVVREGAEKVSVVGNRISSSTRQGIAIRDGVDEATVSGNIVTGGETSVYVRESGAVVKGNTLTDATSHAVTFVGDTVDTELVQNAISGKGPSAIDAQRAEVDRDGWDNDVSGWEDTTPFLVTLKRFLQPLTAMWLVLAGLLVFTAVRGVRAHREKRHPYAATEPMWDHAVLEHPELEEARS